MAGAILFSKVGEAATRFPDFVSELQGFFAHYGLPVGAADALPALADRTAVESDFRDDLVSMLNVLCGEEQNLSYLEMLGLLLVAAVGEDTAQAMSLDDAAEEPMRRVFNFVVEARRPKPEQEIAGAAEDNLVEPESFHHEEHVEFAPPPPVPARVPVTSGGVVPAQSRGSMLARALALAADEHGFDVTYSPQPAVAKSAELPVAHIAQVAPAVSEPVHVSAPAPVQTVSPQPVADSTPDVAPVSAAVVASAPVPSGSRTPVLEPVEPVATAAKAPEPEPASVTASAPVPSRGSSTPVPEPVTPAPAAGKKPEPEPAAVAASAPVPLWTRKAPIPEPVSKPAFAARNVPEPLAPHSEEDDEALPIFAQAHIPEAARRAVPAWAMGLAGVLLGVLISFLWGRHPSATPAAGTGTVASGGASSEAAEPAAKRRERVARSAHEEVERAIAGAASSGRALTEPNDAVEELPDTRIPAGSAKRKTRSATTRGTTPSRGESSVTPAGSPGPAANVARPLAGGTVPAVRAVNLNPPADMSSDARRGMRTRVPSVVTGSSGIMAANVISAPAPAYPAQASAAKVEGEVVIEAVVGRDGTVKEARVVSGPELLRDAAVNAVQRWQYRPYEVDGAPAEIATTARLQFRLSPE